ncbi:MAG: DUF3408 domain-containing protein [Tannerellaceae bacterium]|jgi:hypothetical protein|nr:DUF3408 domain-containing protein [Tannerellaceae bacterium]
MKLFENQRNKKESEQQAADYASVFLTKRELESRQCVYISRKVHATILEITQIVSAKGVTVGGYIDSILMEHLETHRDEIVELYNRELAKKIGNRFMDLK